MQIKGQVLFCKKLPQLSKVHKRNSILIFILIYDKKLLRHHPYLKSWLQQFDVLYPVVGDETLKDLNAFPQHCNNIASRILKKYLLMDYCFVALGGGSICDFTGFLSSVFQRGIRSQLIHIPSTLLAAADAVHGGKTALNVSKYKNQIGSFFPAYKIYIVHSLFKSQNPRQTIEGFVEMVKIALLTNKPLWEQMQTKKKHPYLFLKKCILEKQTIVKADFKEEKNLRPILNYGHTLGHALESCSSMSHGQAVFYGMCFSLRLGVQLKLMSKKEGDKILHSPLFQFFQQKLSYQKKWPTPHQIRLALLRDKKRCGNQFIQFIFLKKISLPLIRKVSIEKILKTYQFYRKNPQNLFEVNSFI